MDKKLKFLFVISFSINLLFNLTLAQQLPASPTNLRASIENQTQEITQIKLNWNYGDTSNIYKFLIYGKKFTEDQYSLIAEVPSFTFEYIDQVPSVNMTYYYYVTALDQNGQESNPSNTVTVNVTKPQIPSSSSGGGAVGGSYIPSQPSLASTPTTTPISTTTIITTTTISTTTTSTKKIIEESLPISIKIKNFYYRVNSKDSNLSYIQNLLKEKGYLINYKNGVFDRYTLVAIKRYQRSKKLYPSGIIGPITLKEIKKDLRYKNINLDHPMIEFRRNLKIRDKGKDVLYLSLILKELGYYKYHPTSIFDRKLESALKNFQKKNQLKATGKLDQNTIKFVNNLFK
jgi:peptidoglycan hydrolase-like protein with peptidoglycan-binding domain